MNEGRVVRTCGLQITESSFCGVMAQSSNVGKEDVPGSSLNGRNPEHLEVAELKYWLMVLIALMKFITKGLGIIFEYSSGC